VFEHLDYVYMPSREVAADVAYFTEVLGAQLIFAIEGMGTRVAMVALTDQPPRILLAGHLDGDQPVLVYRVDDLTAAMAELEGRGWTPGHTLEIPQGRSARSRPRWSAAGDLPTQPPGRRGS
jgi:hypothetical protein